MKPAFNESRKRNAYLSAPIARDPPRPAHVNENISVMFSSVPFVTVRGDLSESYFHRIYKHLIIRLAVRSRCVPAVHGLVRFLSSLAVAVERSTMLDIFVHCCGRGLCDRRREMHHAPGRIEMGLMNYFALQSRWTWWVYLDSLFLNFPAPRTCPNS